MSRSTAMQTPPWLAHRWARRAAIAFGALLAFWLLAWLGGPALLRWQLEKQATQALGRPVQVAEVQFHPWSLSLWLRGLQIGATADAPTSTPPQLAVEEIHVNAELQSLLRLAPVIDALSVRGPQLRLTHLGEGRYDIDDILAKLRTPDEPASPMPRFAVFNISLSGGRLDFMDAPRQAHHTLADAQLDIPFLSNLGSRREVLTTPQLAFKLNGTEFDSQADTTPFADDHRTQAKLQIQALDLAPYLPYWPSQWPVRPRSGRLDVDMALSFEQQEQPQVDLSGSVRLSQWQVDEQLNGQTAPLLAFDRLELAVNHLKPLEQQADLKALELDTPTVHLRRDRQGQLHLQRIQRAFQAASSTPPPSSAAQPPAATPSAPWHVSLAQLQLNGGTLHWQDASTRPAATLSAEQIAFSMQDIRWPSTAPAPLKGSLMLAGQPVTWHGQANEQQAQLELSVNGLPLNLAKPYWAQVMRPALGGQASVQAQLAWQAAVSNQPAGLHLTLPELTLANVTLGTPKNPDLRWASLALTDTQIDLISQRVRVGQVQLNRPQLRLQRQANGRWMFDYWLPEATRTATTQSASAAAPQTDPGEAWQIAIDAVALNGGGVQFRDASAGSGVALDASQLQLKLSGLQPLARQQVAMPLTVSGKVAVPKQEPGRLAFNGKLRLASRTPQGAPLDLRGALQLERLPAHALEPYLADTLNFELLRADASYRGNVALSLPSTGPSLRLQGQAAVEDLRASTLHPTEDLLEWKALNLRGLDVQLEQGQLQHLTVGETVLSDYFARVIIDPQGQINLQGLVRPAAGAQAESPTTPTPTNGQQAAATTANTGPRIDFGPIGVLNGRVRFSDRFIQPNYTANLSELSGNLAAFSNRPGADNTPGMAELSLRGRVEGSATLDVSGKLNPLAQPLALDVRGQVRELELPPLTPYSSKYAGYGIARGKLSVDVTYRIDPSGQLQANNQIILDQLRFGDRIEGSDAPNLPIKLAVALLTDRNGVIDINLPISGSLNDPQFRLGPIIVRLIVNLIGKAITAPFALIGSAFSGGDDLQQVTFAPGSAALTEDAQKSLDKVAQALIDRPALRLTVVGQSRLDVEREAYRRRKLDEQVATEKRRIATRDSQAAPAQASVSPDEYPKLLKEVYRRADITKPRNLLGLAKTLPVPDMEALLLAAIPVGRAEMDELAVARGVAVKDHLASRQVPAERLFLGAPHNTTPDAPAGSDTGAKAELKLSAN